MKDFTDIETDRILFRNDFFFIIKDAFPVSPGHLLIISKEVRKEDISKKFKCFLFKLNFFLIINNVIIIR